MKTNSYTRLAVFIGLLPIILLLITFQSLPDQIPIHWNIKGEIDNYTSKYTMLFIVIIPLVIFLGMRWMPRFDPNREAYQKHHKAYAISILLLVGFLGLLACSLNLVALQFPINLVFVLKLLLGLLFICLGNFMGQLRPNFFIGFRSPWTINSERTWRKTHKLGGIYFIITGLLFLISTVLSGQLAFLLPIGTLTLAVIHLYIYAYYDFKSQH